MEEIRRDIEGYKGLYKISNLGRVKSFHKLKEIILKINKNNYGYGCVVLCKDGKCKNEKVHRLVGKAFIPNLENKSQINHKDGDKLNNYVSNLERCTNLENQQHSWKELDRKGHMLGKYGKYCPNSKKVNQYTKDGILIKIWYSMKDVERNLLICSKNISSCCRGKAKTAGGFKREYN